MNAEQLGRFNRFVYFDPSGCWLWTGGKARGYGRFALHSRASGIRPRILSAHRVSYEHYIRPIPPGLHIDHLCRVPACVNPCHLEPVPLRENVLRGLKGRMVTGCPHGHRYTPENTRIKVNGRRACRQCERDRANATNRRKKASGIRPAGVNPGTLKEETA